MRETEGGRKMTESGPEPIAELTRKACPVVGCIFRLKADSDSGSIRTPVPVQSGHRNIDDWLRNPLAESQTPDLLEILEDRYGRASTMLATQIPVADWHDRLGNAILSDAVMDRIIHNAYRLELCGESIRKRRSLLTYSGLKEV